MYLVIKESGFDLRCSKYLARIDLRNKNSA